jgi:hypothetical protein
VKEMVIDDNDDDGQEQHNTSTSSSSSNILQKSRNLFENGWQKAMELEPQHDVLRRSVQGVGSVMDWAADRVCSSLRTNDDGTEDQHQRQQEES